VVTGGGATGEGEEQPGVVASTAGEAGEVAQTSPGVDLEEPSIEGALPLQVRSAGYVFKLFFKFTFQCYGSKNFTMLMLPHKINLITE